MSYTGTTPKDLDLSTPDGAAEYGNILDDAIIEVKKVFKYSQAINTVTTDTTLDATYSFVLANKATAIAITLPSASTVASSTFTKEYRIKNIGVGACTITGTVTLNGSATVNPVLSQYTEIYLWTDGATWYGMRFSDDNIANCVVMTNSSGLIDPNSIGGGLAMTGETSSENAVPVTIIVSTEITTINFGAVTSGDRIYVSSWVAATKGGTSGLTSISIDKKSGTATISTYHDQSGLYSQRTHPASAAEYFTTHGVLKITGSGTLEISLSGTSAGSNSTVATGNGDLYAFFLKKQ